MVDCPVDGIKNIKGDKCPQCDTDLTPLIHFNELPEKYYLNAIDLLKAQRTDEAIEKLINALTFNTNDIRINIALAEAYSKKGMYREALNRLEKATQIDPANTDIKSKMDEVRGLQENERIKITNEKRKLKTFRTLLIAIPIAAFIFGMVIIPLKNYIVPGSPIDLESLAKQINNKITQIPDLENLNIGITGNEQKIFLSGEVPSILHKNFITYLAENIAPPNLVDNTNLIINVPEVPEKIIQYTVRRGDALILIAYSFYNDIEKWVVIAETNNITNPDEISEGQVLLLPLTKDMELVKF